MPRWSIIVLILVVTGVAGCGRENRRRHATDIPLEVTLERNWVRERAALDWVNVYDTPIQVDFSADGAAPAFVVMVALLLIEGGIETTATMADKTKVVVYVAGHEGYRQRLYWGENILWLPAAAAESESASLVVEISGDRHASCTVPLDLTAGDALNLQ